MGLGYGDFFAFDDAVKGVPVVIFLGYIALVVGNEEGGEGQRNDQSDESEQGSPYGEAEQQDGGVEAHGLAHDLGSDDHVDDNLHNNEDGHG